MPQANIRIPSLDSWQLVAAAAKAGRDVEAHAEAGYEFARLHGLQHRSVPAKIANRLLDWSCAFGFRPIRTAGIALSVWFAWGLMYWILTLFTRLGLRGDHGVGDSWISKLGYSLYFSGIALTTVGFGDVAPCGWPTMVLSGVEGPIGIVIFALLVFSLTKRYTSY